jgi:hypothetical protein
MLLLLPARVVLTCQGTQPYLPSQAHIHIIGKLLLCLMLLLLLQQVGLRPLCSSTRCGSAPTAIA